MNNVEARALQSNIFQLLAGVPITASQQLYFDTTAERDAYFDGKVIYTFTDMKFIREHRAVRVALNVETLEAANYMRFKNAEYNGIWMYCFIDRVEYINPNTSYIFFSLDAWQTYFSNVEIRDCDIAREHVATGADYNENIIPESIDYGELRMQRAFPISFESPGTSISYVIISTVDLINSGGTVDNPVIYGAVGSNVQGLPSAAGVFCVTDGTSDIYSIFDALSNYPWVSQSITAIYPYPSVLLPDFSIVESAMGFRIGRINGNSAKYSQTILSNWKSLFPNYPQGKMYCYPYSMIEMVMPNGATFEIRPELLSNNNITVRLQGSVIPDAVVLCKLLDYNGGDDYRDVSYNTGVVDGFPSFPVQNDQFTVAKSQASAINDLVRVQAEQNIRLQSGLSLVGLIGGIASGASSGGLMGAVAGGLSSGVSAVEGIVSADIHEQQNAEMARTRIGMMQGRVGTAGASSGGIASVSLSYNSNLYIIFRFWTLQPEYREKVAQYFDAFGYKSNRIGVPNMNNRPRYNYVRCNSVNIYGNIPNEHLNTIRSMFINGVTFWHDHNNVGTYGNNG